jgi:lipopolysaccharide export LptBFGC system permease protein LptF
VHSPSAQFPLGEGSTTHDQMDEPDTWTTPQLISYLAAWDPDSNESKRSDYNNARLSLHLRLFIPFSLVAFALFAAGLGLRRGTSDSLIAVIIIIFVVALSTTPALFYVKNAVDHRLVSPSWLLWPQATIFASLGAWWIAHPDLANDRGPGSQRIRTWLHGITSRLAVLVRKRIGGRENRSTRLPGTGHLSVLTRLMLGQGISTWIAVLFIGTFLVVLGQVIGRMGVFVRALTRRPREMTEFLVFSLPDFVGMWLPMSVGAAALLVAAPMLRRGNLMVLSASGIPLRRVFAPFLLIAVTASVCKFVIDDQLSTRLGPIVSEREESMYVRDSTSNRRDPPAGWRTEQAFLLSGNANHEQGIFESFAAFAGKSGQGTALLAKALRWGGDEDPRWHLDQAVEVSAQGQRRDLGETTTDIPAWLGLPSLAAVELSLVPDRIKTSNQLVASNAPLGFHIILSRIMTAMTPFLGLLLALPPFVRFENRNRLGKTLATSCLLLVMPVVVVALANRAILSNQGQPLLTACAVLGLLGGIGGWRWVRMRP